MKKYKFLFVLLVLVLVGGCQSLPIEKANSKYSLVTIQTGPQGIYIPILYYEDSDGNFYYRVLPSMDALDFQLDGINDYSYDWTKIDNPTELSK